jgi:hypothetical protein
VLYTCSKRRVLSKHAAELILTAAIPGVISSSTTQLSDMSAIRPLGTRERRISYLFRRRSLAVEGKEGWKTRVIVVGERGKRWTRRQRFTQISSPSHFSGAYKACVGGRKMEDGRRVICVIPPDRGRSRSTRSCPGLAIEQLTGQDRTGQGCFVVSLDINHTIHKLHQSITVGGRWNQDYAKLISRPSFPPTSLSSPICCTTTLLPLVFLQKSPHPFAPTRVLSLDSSAATASPTTLPPLAYNSSTLYPYSTRIPLSYST